jgi:hypothetical protein
MGNLLAGFLPVLIFLAAMFVLYFLMTIGMCMMNKSTSCFGVFQTGFDRWKEKGGKRS